MTGLTPCILHRESDDQSGPSGHPITAQGHLPSESAQFKIHFSYSLYPEDSAGEAYYRIKGTDKTFHVQADYVLRPGWWEQRAMIDYSNLETHGVRKGSLIDIGWAEFSNNQPLQWVLTGSEKYGYWSSHNPPVAWMHAILDAMGDRKLKYIACPATQWLDFYGQLVRGSRWFDVRPCLGNGGKHMLGHYSVDRATPAGGNGLSVDEMIEQINRQVASSFMDEYPGELVILDVNNEAGFYTDRAGTPRLTEAQWRPIMNKIQDGIKKPCKGFGERRLDQIPLNEFMGDGKGCVLTVVRSIPGVERDSDKGFYLASQLPQANDYSNTDDYNHMRENQMAKLKLKRRLGPEGDPNTQDEFFVLSWTMTDASVP
ncbi:hypothetical protein VTJ49DRAFT_1428 [Mycothermus thermophilus]|uniref:Uncharacterized protein n=1 Tax=Humicola insolens TaxID=85995 RepID=A0ABR3VCQ0_HUMIN